MPLREFYGSLADRDFHSTQYIRHPSEPLYTPEPDLIHEVIGHGNLLAHAARSPSSSGWPARPRGACETDEALQFIADVFWFTLEFGVVFEDGELKAYGAGILSSYGEIEEFRSMEIRPLDFAEMGDASSTTSRTTSRSSSRRGRWRTCSRRSAAFFAERRRRHSGPPGARSRAKPAHRMTVLRRFPCTGHRPVSAPLPWPASSCPA